MRIFIVLLIVVAAGQLRAQGWQRTNFSGTSLVLASSGKVLVACDTTGSQPVGTQYSTDLGETWIRSNGPAYLEQLIVDNGVFYGVDWLTGALWKSGDDGHSWDRLSDLVQKIYFSGGTLISDNYSTLSVSSDGVKWDTIGESARPFDSVPRQRRDLQITCASDSMLAGTLNFPARVHRKNRGFVSYSHGATWIECTLPDSSAEIAAVYGSNVILSITHDAIFRSVDTGRNWVKMIEGNSLGAYSIRQSGDYVYCINNFANDSGSYSSDRGLTWHTAPGISDPDSSGAKFAAIGRHLFLANPKGRIYRLATGSSNISPKNHGGSIQVFPNPANGLLYLVGAPIYAKIQIADAAGRLVLSQTNSTNTINIRSLPSGDYTILVGDERLFFVKLS